MSREHFEICGLTTWFLNDDLEDSWNEIDVLSTEEQGDWSPLISPD